MKNLVVIKQMELGPMQNFVYLIGCPRTKEAAVVDPAWDIPAILAAAQKDGMTIKHVFLTHHHFDHTNGVDQIVAKTNSPVYVNENETPFVSIKKNRIREVCDGDELTMGDVTVRFLHTPGHSPGSQCILVEKNLFSGDTLFIDGCGRTDLEGGDEKKLLRSIKEKIGVLDDDVIVFPGHHYADVPTATIGEQKRSNPFLANIQREVER